MSFIFKFSKFILVPLCSEWLDLKEVIKLESLCCKSCCFTDQYAHLFEVLFPHDFKLSCSSARWRHCRGLMGWPKSVLISPSLLKRFTEFHTSNCVFFKFPFCSPTPSLEYQTIKDCCSMITILRIDYCPQELTSNFVSFLQHCSSLEEISFGWVFGIERVLVALSECCPNLVKCAFDNNRYRYSELTSSAMITITKLFPRLKEFSLSVPLMQGLFIGEAMKHPDSAFRALLFPMDVDNTSYVSEGVVYSFMAAGGMKSLTSLRPAYWSNETLSLIAQSCPLLTDLSLPRIFNDDRCLLHMISYLPALASLSIMGIECVGVVLKELSTLCPSLTSLSVRSVSDELLLIPHLKQLCVALPVPPYFDVIVRLKSLTCLQLGLPSHLQHRVYSAKPLLEVSQGDRGVLSGEQLLSLMSHCAVLTSLDVEVGACSASEWQMFARSCTKLKSLTVSSSCSNLKASIVADIVKASKRLRRLSIAAGTSLVEDRQLLTILQKMNMDLFVTVDYKYRALYHSDNSEYV